MRKNSIKKIGSSLLTLSLASASILSPIALAAESVKLNETSDVYINADNAINNVNSVGKYSAGNYYIYKEFSNAVNITKSEGTPGAWILKSKLNNVKNTKVSTSAPQVKKAVARKSTTKKVVAKKSANAEKVGSDKINLLEEVSIHINAEDAKSGSNSRGTYSKGEYYIYKEYNGALNISRAKGVPGGWIFLKNSGTTVVKENKPKVKAKVQAQTTRKNTSKQNTRRRQANNSVSSVAKVSDERYELKDNFEGFMNAQDAKNSVNAVTTVYKGKYYIYKSYNGMLNLSTSKNQPGAWINPNAKQKVASERPTESKTQASVQKNSATGVALVSKAASFIGTRYVYGGTTPSGFDCSGFAQYLYRQYGYSIPRTATPQSRIGTYVSKSDLKAGDLVFFGTSVNDIWHVAIYDGNGGVIHALNEDRGTVRSSLSSSWYQNYYVTARRVIK